MTEMLDIYDDNFTRIGTKERAQVHRDGDWHRVFHCWVIYCDDDGQGHLIVQKRAADKDTFPDYLDVSAAGHYEAGETIKDGVREVAEELGLTVTLHDLIAVGKRISTVRYQELIDRQCADVFLCDHRRALRDYAYDPDEVAGLVDISLQAGLSLFSGETDVISAQAVGWQQGEIELRRSDFIPTPDQYFYKALILAQRYFNGDKHLLI